VRSGIPPPFHDGGILISGTHRNHHMKIPLIVFTTERQQRWSFWLLALSLVLNLIVAVGNWHLYARVARLEATLGLQAMPQSQQK
jgi:hypothetical protein